jgi:hypothetical protein
LSGETLEYIVAQNLPKELTGKLTAAKGKVFPDKTS